MQFFTFCSLSIFEFGTGLALISDALAEFQRTKESWTMQNGNENKLDQSVEVTAGRTWTDIEQLARRVIHAANLAVMAHAELDPFVESNPSENQTGKKAG
jgi:hypothetical protein